MRAQPDNRIAKTQENENCSEIVYTELNLEKWSIWEPSSSKKLPRARLIERQRVLPDGSLVTAKVEIGFTQHGNLSTRDQKIYYVLFKVWDDAGRPETPVVFSVQKIARLLGEEWSSHAHRTITRSLLQLRNIWFNWENSYFDKESGDHIELLDTFNILSELKLARRTRKLHATTEMCLFQFHREILKNLHANHTTPLFLATVLSFKSEIAQLLYPRLDLFLADKKHYERRTKELFEELGLEAETYRHKSARKRVIEKALEELRGVPLTTGCIVSATVEPTKDNSDFKIVIHKGARRARLAAPKPVTPTAPPAQQTPPTQQTLLQAQGVKSPASAPAKAQVEAEEAILVRYFHSTFHGAAPKGPLNPKELVQAARLLQTHSLTSAKAMVDYAKEEAPRTNYKPASFNGILQYEARFEAQHAEHALRQQKRQAQQEHAATTQKAQETRQHEIVGSLIERVGAVQKNVPQAFAAFLRRVESERDAFLNTPVARQASPTTRAMLSRAYEQPAKRLEIFLDCFAPGSDGEALLSVSPHGWEAARWIKEFGASARPLLDRLELPEGASEVVR